MTRKAPPAPVSDADLSFLIAAIGRGQSLTDADRTDLAGALQELQRHRSADSARLVGIAKRTQKQRAQRIEELWCDVTGLRGRRDDAMRAARDARLAFQKLEPAQVAALVGGHCYRAHCHNRAAVRVCRQIRGLQQQVRS